MKSISHDSELDSLLIIFDLAMTEFDDTISKLEIAIEVCKSAPFTKIYKEKRYPFLYDIYKPKHIKDAPNIMDGLYTEKQLLELTKAMDDALVNNILDVWNKNKARFFKFAIAHRCSCIDFMSVNTYQINVWNLLKIVRYSKSFSDRKIAILSLLELDLHFLSAPGAKSTIRFASIENDLGFLAKLSRALNPKRETTQFKGRRKIYGLHILSGLGYKTKTYKEWAAFFDAYEKFYLRKHGKAHHDHFGSYTSTDTIRQAVKDNNVEKLKGRPGPNRTSSD